MSSNGNGHTDLETALDDKLIDKQAGGAFIKIEDVMQEDGRLLKGGTVGQSVIHRVLSVDNDHFDNEIKTARYKNSDEADLAVSALYECEILHMNPRPIKLQILARSSGDNHQLLNVIKEMITHSTFNINKHGERNASNKTGSPLS